MKTTKEMIEVMTAYDNGYEVEYFNYGINSWKDARYPDWDWVDNDYRIKEQKKTITIEKWLCKDGENSYYIYEGSSAEGLETVKKLDTYEVEL